MLAPNHLLFATGSTLIASVYYDVKFFLPFLIFVAIASVLPDIDHQGSEISRIIPVIHKAFPHRGVTHSLFATGVFGICMYFLSSYYHYFSILLLVFGLVGVYLIEKTVLKKLDKALSKGVISHISRPKLILRIATGIMSLCLFFAMVLVWYDEYRNQIIALLVIGYCSHLVGDIVTKDGIPIFWPIRTRVGFGFFRTGGIIEKLISISLLVLNLWGLYMFGNKYEVTSNSYWSNYFRIVFTG